MRPVKRSTKCWWFAEGLLAVALFDAHYGPTRGWAGAAAGVSCALLGVGAIVIAGLAGGEMVREGDS